MLRFQEPSNIQRGKTFHFSSKCTVLSPFWHLIIVTEMSSSSWNHLYLPYTPPLFFLVVVVVLPDAVCLWKGYCPQVCTCSRAFPYCILIKVCRIPSYYMLFLDFIFKMIIVFCHWDRYKYTHIHTYPNVPSWCPCLETAGMNWYFDHICLYMQWLSKLSLRGLHLPCMGEALRLITSTTNKATLETFKLSTLLALLIIWPSMFFIL